MSSLNKLFCGSPKKSSPVTVAERLQQGAFCGYKVNRLLVAYENKGKAGKYERCCIAFNHNEFKVTGIKGKPDFTVKLDDIAKNKKIPLGGRFIYHLKGEKFKGKYKVRLDQLVESFPKERKIRSKEDPLKTTDLSPALSQQKKRNRKVGVGQEGFKEAPSGSGSFKKSARPSTKPLPQPKKISSRKQKQESKEIVPAPILPRLPKIPEQKTSHTFSKKMQDVHDLYFNWRTFDFVVNRFTPSSFNSKPIHVPQLLAVNEKSPEELYREALKLYLEKKAQDPRQVFDLLKKAADQGHAPAQFLVGVLYSSGEEIEKNDDQAVLYFQKAADQGDPCALRYLGMMHQEGRGGLPKNLGKAKELYEKAALKGDKASYLHLGRIELEDFDGHPPHLYSALLTFQQIADGKGEEFLTAQLEIGWIHAVAGDYEKANKAFKSVLEGWKEEYSFDLFAKAANNMGVLYAKGWGVEKSYAIAVDWYKIGSPGLSRSGGYLFAPAINSLAHIYGRGGHGVEADAVQAGVYLNHEKVKEAGLLLDDVHQILR